MLTLLTACGRNDLLCYTLASLCDHQKYDLSYPLIVHEDKPTNAGALDFLTFDFFTFPSDSKMVSAKFHHTGGIGQHASIAQFLNYSPSDQYYLHCEDDWKFNNSYDWIAESIAIMEADPKIIKVLARKGSPHPCNHNKPLNKLVVGGDGVVQQLKYGILEPWINPQDNKEWNGFSWNPGVTRLDLLKEFYPLNGFEQDVAAAIHDAGYKVAELSVPVYEHIGDGRSTH